MLATPANETWEPAAKTISEEKKIIVSSNELESSSPSKTETGVGPDRDEKPSYVSTGLTTEYKYIRSNLALGKKKMWLTAKFWNINPFGNHVRLRDLPAQLNVLNEFSLCEAIEQNKLRKFKQCITVEKKKY